MRFLKSLWKVFRSKKGAETVEYVIIMCLAVALGGALVSAVKSEPVQCKMKQVIEQSLPMEYSGDKSECGELAADAPQKNHHKEKIPQPANDDKNFLSKLWDDGKEFFYRGYGLDELASLKNKGFKEQLDGFEKWGLELSPLGGISHDTEKLTGFNPIDWIVDNPGKTLMGIAVIASMFTGVGEVGAVAFAANTLRTAGYGMAGGGVFGGLFSWAFGGDPVQGAKDGAVSGFWGGLAGYGAFRGAGRLIGRYGKRLSPFIQKWLPKSIGGSSGAFTDSSVNDWLTTGKVNLKKGLILSTVIGALTIGGGAVVDKAVPSMAQGMKQFGINVNMGSDGTLAMPFFNKAEDQVSKAAGKGSGTASKLSREELQSAVEDYTLKIEKGVEKGEPVRYVTYADGTKNKVVNGKYADRVNPLSNVRYDDNGFPVFDEWSKFEYTLDKPKYLESDTVQFKEATNALKEEIEKNPAMKEHFTPKQLADINKGKKKIKGLTWHHHQDSGRLQLVPTEVHQPTSHTGGRAIWGGGEEYR